MATNIRRLVREPDGTARQRRNAARLKQAMDALADGVFDLDDSGTLTINLPAGSGLTDEGGSLAIALATIAGLEIVNGLRVKVDTGRGIVRDEGGLQVDLDDLIVVNEVPTGSANGVNDTFLLNFEPVENKANIYLNGVYMVPGGDYNHVSTQNIVFVSEQIPQTGDIVTANYRIKKD